jgi:hypothetical protein
LEDFKQKTPIFQPRTFFNECPRLGDKALFDASPSEPFGMKDISAATRYCWLRFGGIGGTWERITETNTVEPCHKRLLGRGQAARRHAIAE